MEPGGLPGKERERNGFVQTTSLEKIKLAGDAELYVNDNRGAILDTKNNRAVLFTIDRKTDTIEQYWDLKGSLFPYKQLLRKSSLDSVLYEEQRLALIKNGDASVRIHNIFADDSSAYLLLSFIFPRVLPDKNVYIAEPNYFIYSRNFFNGKKDLQFIDLKSLENKTQSKYQASIEQSFYFRNGKLFLPLKDTSRLKASVNIISSWSRTATGFQADSGFLAISPAELKDLWPDSVRIRNNHHFLFNDNAKLIYNYNKSEKIPIKTVMLFHAGKLLDIQERESRLLLLVLKKNKVDVVIYDRQLEQVFGQVPVIIPPNCQLSSARFCNGNKLAIVSADKKLLHILEMD